MSSSWRVAALGSFVSSLVLVLTQPALAANTLTVDDDGQDCPAAVYTSVQSAVNAAVTGDTVVICPGTYVEGSGAAGTNALTINKSITVRGAGADDVTIEPRRTGDVSVGGNHAYGQIAASNPVLRDCVGDIIGVCGGSSFPISVDISGISVNGNGVYSEVGIGFLDAGGSLVRDRVTGIVTSEQGTACANTSPLSCLPGAYRANNVGVGVAQMTAAPSPPAGATARSLLIDHSRVDQYNTVGVLVDGATGDTPPLTASGIVNSATIRSSSIIGRLECTNFLADGNCSSVGLLTTGPLQGQDGVRVTAGASATVTDSILSQNLVNGTGAPTRNSATNNANLKLGSGVRLLGAGASSFSRSNIVDNAYGVYNVQLDGATADTANRISATNDWWGLRYTGATTNSGPAISPVTNPQVPENPVNGAPVADATCVDTLGAPVFNSDAVNFCPFRNGSQADPDTGEYPVVDAPLPVDDTGPSISLSSDHALYARGETAALTATAADDFGVKEVTFYDGATAIGTDTTPPYTQNFQIPADAPCGNRAFQAVAEDSSGQTATSGLNVSVDEPTFHCAAHALSIVFNSPPSVIPENGTTVSATPTADATVTQVEFFLGSRSVCVDNTAPYSCNVVPLDSEAGAQTLRAVVSDSFEQTAEATTPVTVSEFAAEAPTISFTSPPSTLPESGATFTAVPVTDTAHGATVQKVEFFIGTRLVCTDTTAPYSCDIVPTRAERGNQSVSAVVTDSATQTASASTPVTVPQFHPNAPSITIDNPPASLPQGGATISATPIVDTDAGASVQDVKFFLGNRLVCTDTTAPYSCDIAPHGDEVGSQSVRAVLTDSSAQTAEDDATVTVPRFTPTGLSVDIVRTKQGKKRYLRTISGQLGLPSGVTPAQGCQAGTVTLNVLRGGLTLFPNVPVALKPDCTYSFAFALKKPRKKKPRFEVDATFGGNTVLEPISNSGRSK
jgi:hypothetical protein